MNVTGPSRAALPGRPAPPERHGSTYEEDLLEFVNQLRPEEMDEIEMLFTRQRRAGVPSSDHDVAMHDLVRQVRALAALDQDRALALRVAAGEDVVDEAPEAVPRQNTKDRWVALLCQFRGWVRTRAAAQWNGNRHEERADRNDGVPSRKLRRVWRSSGSRSAGIVASGVSSVNRPTGHDCVICQDPIHGTEIRVPCGHYYDVGCITDLFRSAAKDETLYPPRCCKQHIPFAHVQPHLPKTLIEALQQKQAEFSTLKRVYCASPACSLFLGPLSENGSTRRVYTCSCGKRTCGKCRQGCRSNWMHVCRPDADATDVLALGRASGWARCPGCAQLIELHLGCFHMTCRCRTEFCYLCRARWKTCECPQWEDRRLLAVAEERVDAQLGLARERGVLRRLNPLPRRVHRARVLTRHARAPAGRARTDVPRPRLDAVQRPVAATASIFPPLPRWEHILQSTCRRVHHARVLTRRARAPAGDTRTDMPRSRPGPVRRLVAAIAPVFPPLPRWGHILQLTRSCTPMTDASSATESSSSSSTSSGDEQHNGLWQRMVHEVMERLRTNHECNHARWSYRPGGGRCQSCGHHLPLYLNRCEGCEMLACNRCRQNRL